jgi:hypothetical protein
LAGVVPGGIGDSATFSTIITANRQVTLDVDTTVHHWETEFEKLAAKNRLDFQRQ